MCRSVRGRRLSEAKSQYLLRLVRRGKHGSIRVRRALVVMTLASGTTVPAIACLVAADEDTVRDVIHAFNDEELACLAPHWAGVVPAGSPTLTSRSSSRRPRPARASTCCRSRTGASANSPATSPAATDARTRDGRRPASCASDGDGCGRSCTPTHHVSATRTGRSLTTPTSTRSWTGSRKSPTDSGPVFRLRPVRAIVADALSQLDHPALVPLVR
ncbi:helix-turn-helix domain-containing protein [Amycolatopsis sp. NPDC051716]|uniref:helix-turn-helix domain-containing protein n=1 Tax=Amycolatopsis sp. NPDC051716 TaxID=3155804 RepID=UPI00342D6284